MSLLLEAPSGEPLSVLAIGAHPDDIEIGAGGLLLQLAARPLQARYVLLTGTAERQAEARAAATAFLPGADLTVELSQLPEGRLPAAWAQVKEILEQVAVSSELIPEHLTDEEILGALDRVPQDFRAVVLLVDVDEFSYKEASAILNVPIGTVMSRLSRGRKLLREQLAETAESYGIGKGKLEGRTA